MSENEFNDKNTNGTEKKKSDAAVTQNESSENSYAQYIYTGEDDVKEKGVQNENPYSKYPSQNSSVKEDGDEVHYEIKVQKPIREKEEGEDEGNPYSDYISHEEISNEKKESDNPYSGYYSKDKITYDNSKVGENPYSVRNARPSQNEFASSFKVNEDRIFSAQDETAPLINEEQERRNFNHIGIAYLLFSLISSAAAWIIQFSVLALNEELLDNMLFRNLLSPICLYLFALPVLLIVLSRCESKAPEKKKLKFGSFMIFVLVSFGLMYIGSIIGNFVMDLLGGIFSFDYSNGLESIIDYDKIWLTAIFTVIVAPIGEEFVFRKLLIDRTQKYGAFISIGMSGLMFGLMHGNFYQFFYAFALGLLLGYIYYNTGKLYITIAIHAIVNFVGSVLTSFLVPISEKMLEINTEDPEIFLNFIQENLLGMIGILLFAAFRYATMACAVIFPIVFWKKLSFPKGEVSIPVKKLIPVAVLNAGIIAMLIVYMLEFAINIFLPLL